MFHILKQRLTVDGFLIPETALHIGTERGVAPVGSDLPVLRNAQGAPFVPGSSLKGAVRGYLEARVRGMIPKGTDTRKLACNIVSNDDADWCISSARMNEMRNEVEDDEELAERVAEESCLLCRTFGSPWLASHVRFADLPVAEGYWIGQFDTRNGVAIDRDKATAADRKLYDYEVVPAGTPFVLSVVGENLDDWQQGLVWLGVHALQRGDIALGGFTSRGLGWVKLKDAKGQFTKDLMELLAGGDVGADVTDEVAQGWVRALQEKVNHRVEVKADA